LLRVVVPDDVREVPSEMVVLPMVVAHDARAEDTVADSAAVAGESFDEGGGGEDGGVEDQVLLLAVVMPP
jgi:hypothetical protein